MESKFVNVKIERHTKNLIKKRYPGLSLNKAFKLMLSETGDYEPPENTNDEHELIFNQIKYFVNSKLKPIGEKFQEMDERFQRLEN